MTDSEELATVRKELQTVKTKAVGKIKALQQRVDALQQQLSERPPAAPPDVASDSSVQSDASGFVKVHTTESSAQLAAREEELNRREAELLERGEMLRQREATISSRSAECAWHASLIAGLREVQSNAQQMQMACESAELAR